MSRSRRLITVAGIVSALALAARPGLSQDAAPDPDAAPPSLSPGADPTTGHHPTDMPGPPLLIDPAPEPDEDDGADRPSLTPVSDGGMPAPGDDDAPRDNEVIPAQDPGSGTGPLPGAQIPPGQPAPAGTGGAGTPFALPAERLPTGPQAATIKIDVQAPASMNLHRPATVTLTVENPGPADAHGVSVRYALPEGLKLLKGEPEVAQQGNGYVSWSLDILPAGVKKTIKVEVEPEARGDYNHAAFVTLLAGSRAKTAVVEPRLKVEQRVARPKVLKGQQVQLDISVTNTGDGPARDVVVHAQLSSGLHQEPEGQVLEYRLDRPLKAHETLKLESLYADTIEGGVQTCTVLAVSPDVVDAPEAHSVQEVEVTQPALTLDLSGSSRRPTDSVAEYSLTISNPGTAPTRNIQVSAALVGQGTPMEPGDGGRWDAKSKRFVWALPQLDPEGTKTFKFQVRLGGVQAFRVSAEVAAVGVSKQLKTALTDVYGSPDIDLDVASKLRVLDVGQETFFQIKLINRGSREATEILPSAMLSENLKVIGTYQTPNEDKKADLDTQSNTVIFPMIDRLAPGATAILYVKVNGGKQGLATCRAFVTHRDLPDKQKLESVSHLQVADGRPAP